MLSALCTAVFGFVMAASWLALVLAEAGRFSAWPCVASGAVMAAVLFFLSRPRGGDQIGPSRNTMMIAGCAALIAVATLVFTRHPGELLLGGWDPGVYVQTAAHIARTGELLIREPDLNRLTSDELAILTRTTSGIVGPFAGMWMLPDGRLSPQFHHLYPALAAIAYSFGGIKVALLVNPLLNAGCVLAMFALARRFVRAPFALAAAAILVLNPAQIWQAKFCTAEMLGQFLLLGGATFFLDALDGTKPRRLHALLAGAAFGLALLARYDTLILIAPLFALTAATIAWLPGRRGAILTWLAFAPFFVHHLVHHHYFAPYYQPIGGPVLKAFALLAIAGVVCGVVTQTGSIKAAVETRAKIIPLLATLGAGLWACFAWIRPYLPPKSALAGADAGNAFYVNAIFGPCVVLFVIALLVALLRERNAPRAIWLYSSTAVFAIVTTIVNTSVSNEHFLMWVTRRFIPVAIPLLILAFARLLDLIAGTNTPRRAAACILLLAAVAASYPAIRAMALLRDWPGLAAWYEQLAPAIPTGARVFCDQRGFAAPLRFLHGTQAYELHLSEKDPARRDRLAAVMTTAAKRGEHIYLLTLATEPLPGCTLTPRGNFNLDSQKLDSAARNIPLTTRAAGGSFTLYEVTAQ